MENKRTVNELVQEINALTPNEKLVIQQQLIETTDNKQMTSEREAIFYNIPRLSDEQSDEMLRTINESKYYTTIAQPQIHDPIAIAEEQGKELPDRYEPTHQDLDAIFGGFQSQKSAEELVEEIYRLRTVGQEREPLNK